MAHDTLPEPGTRLGARDLCEEAVAGILQRPGRSALTVLGTVLGIGGFVAVLGLTATAAGRIGEQLDLTRATTVTVADRAGTDQGRPGADPPTSFPADADERLRRIDGVEAAGVWWPVPGNPVLSDRPTGGEHPATTVLAATPGAVAAMAPTLRAGVTMDAFAQRTGQRVVLLGQAAAEQLGVSRLDAQPAVYLDGLPYTVIGIYSDVRRQPATPPGAIVPARTALEQFGPPGGGADRRAQGLIATRAGAASVVAEQAAVALRPDSPDSFTVTPPADPHGLQDGVGSDLTRLFLALATVCLLVGAAGIANATLVAVLERTEEIGLRRALGARTRHIAAQFLTESTVLGTLGGLVGTGLGVLAVLAVAAAHDWTAVMHPAATLAAPLIGSVTGLLAGLYPSLRAARTDPLTALRGG
ncbi:ABC transporter permease [Kitasatospora sp. CMC57]|uniref:ABC transporter permease n=1 Tax=Kitasatospora sp. CMC57 TaxID=3231513 RepID=A0AB33JVN7_9ACTN